MPITSSDLVWYGSLNMPEDNSSTTGGDIDEEVKISFTDLAANDNVTVISSAGGDTMNITITGLLVDGTLDTDVITLNGTTRVLGAKTFERILKITLASAATGTVTVTRDNATTYTTIATLEPGILEVRSLFYNASAEANGGSSRDYYEKVFVKNEHGSLTLNSATIVEFSDPGAVITFDLEDAKNSDNSTASRLNTAPTSMLSSFSNSDKTVPDGYLEAGSYQGIWLKLTLASGTVASKNTYSLHLTGTTT